MSQSKVTHFTNLHGISQDEKKTDLKISNYNSLGEDHENDTHISSADEEPETQLLSTFDFYDSNGKVEVKVLNFEEWKSEVEQKLQNTFGIPNIEFNSNKLYSWFLENKSPIEVSNHIGEDIIFHQEQNTSKLFDRWLQEVDALVIKKLGVHRRDLPDFAFYDCFSEMVSPMEMVNYMQRKIKVEAQK